jgi:hypothetical protein
MRIAIGGPSPALLLDCANRQPLPVLAGQGLTAVHRSRRSCGFDFPRKRPPLCWRGRISDRECVPVRHRSGSDPAPEVPGYARRSTASPRLGHHEMAPRATSVPCVYVTGATESATTALLSTIPARRCYRHALTIRFREAARQTGHLHSVRSSRIGQPCLGTERSNRSSRDSGDRAASFFRNPRNL